MYAVTVQDILTLLAPRGARLVAGEQGLRRKVTWAITMRTRPPAFEAPAGGELALLSLSALRSLQLLDRHITLERIVHDLHAAEVAAVAVAGDEPLPAEAISLAEQISLPLIQLPRGTPLWEIERDIISHVVNQQGELERQASEIYHTLLALSIQGERAPAIAEHLARLTGKTIVVEDEQRVAILYAPPPGSPLSREHVLAQLAKMPDAPPPLSTNSPRDSVVRDGLMRDAAVRQRLDDRGLTRFVAPIQLKHEVIGYLSLIGDDATLDSLDRLVTAQASAIFALAFAREREIAAVEQRLRGDVVDDLLAGNYASEAQIIQRAAHLGLDLTRSYIVAVASPDDGQEYHRVDLTPRPLTGRSSILQGRDPNLTRPLLSLGEGQHQEPAPAGDEWQRRLRDEVERSFPGAWIRFSVGASSTRERAVLLLPLPANSSLPAVLERLRALQHRMAAPERAMFASLRGQNREPSSLRQIAIGVGRVYEGLDGLRRAFREAEQALEIGQQLFGPAGLTYFGDLGIYRLLFPLRDTTDLTAFYTETLGPLVEYDRRTNGELLHTLEVYFACHTNLSEAARALHLHRNSLLYRLQRIEEVLGISLADADTSLSLQVALRIRRMLGHD
jgi:purine catabolism regulator